VVDDKKAKWSLFKLDKSVAGSKSRPYVLLPLSSVSNPLFDSKRDPEKKKAADAEAKLAAETAALAKETVRARDPLMHLYRAPAFFAAAAGRTAIVPVLLERHRDCAADKARIYTVRPLGGDDEAGGKFEIVDLNDATPLPDAVRPADVAKANGFKETAKAFDESYRMCSVEDCSIM
jgi:hypothetical protein